MLCRRQVCINFILGFAIMLTILNIYKIFVYGMKWAFETKAGNTFL